MKTFFITLIAIVFCSAVIFIGAPDLFPQTRRGMKISVRTNTGENIELYKASYALIVGNGNYRNGWDPLPGATRDVQEVAEALKTHGFNVTLKTDLTKDKFEDAFETFVQNGKNEDARLLFYYAGHGYTEELADGEHLGYLVMIDAPFPKNGDIDGSKSVDMESLVTQSRRMQSRHVLFVFDSCFSGTILNARSQIPPPYVSNNVKYPVRQFITAGRADETVPDHSVFKEAFLNLVKGIAPEPIADGYITGAELGLYLKTEVPKYNRGQNPQYGKINNPKLNQGDFVFVLPREAPPPGDALSTMATLNVTSTPSGATVYLNGIIIGKTPMRGYQIETGVRRQKQVTVRLEYDGYKSRTKTLILKGGQSLPWTVRLEKFTTIATLQVTSTPSGASVYLDGAVVGKTPLYGFEVDTGTKREKRVEIGVEFPGYKSQVRGVTLKGGQEVPWDVQLEKQARPKPAAIQARPKPAAMPDTTEMVLIPAGDFQMGSNDSNADDDEKPVHTVYVDAFYIDKYEVTNAQFKAFVDANPPWQKNRIPKKYHSGRYLQDWRGNSYPSGKGNHPVVYVSWYAAMAYAQWAGKRLPTEAEWEKAARGGLVDKKYSRGNAIDTSQAHYYNRDVEHTMPVGTYAPNGYGLYDLAGNVWEWCIDTYEKNFYARSPRRNPLAGEMTPREVMTNYKNVKNPRVLRGSSWSTPAQNLRVANRVRSTPTLTSDFIGFRCARAVTQGGQEMQQEVQLETQATPQQGVHTSTILGKDGARMEKQAIPQQGTPLSTILGKDGAEMVLIPAGEFQMGSNDSQAYDEKPVHTVYVDAFYIDTYEVTNAQFKAFINANPQWQKDKIDVRLARGGYLSHWDGNNYPHGKSNHPVTRVSWYAAMAYAQWAGKRLPTEAEWEKAARGGLERKKYPWGNEIDTSQANCNRDVGNTTPVGRYAPNGYGLYDMAGNVWEWCLDAYEADFYARSPRRNPLAGEMTLTEVMTNYQYVITFRVLRGGGWFNSAQGLRVANRFENTPTSATSLYGFRCARDVTQGGPEGQRDVQLETQETPQQDAHTSTILGKDGAKMVLIPAGDFQMGSNDTQTYDNEKPVHTVYVDAFYMDTYEVTNAQFKAFINANPQWQKDKIDARFDWDGYLSHWDGNNYPYGKSNHPVTHVSWYAAMAYAQWAGKRLPTEAEWEKAARGGLVGKKYPRGNAIDTRQANYNSRSVDTTPVGRYAPNGYGLYDMAGNVWEWCFDAYDDGFYAHSPRRNPLAGEMNLTEVMTNYKNVTTSRVLRGGSWLNTAQNLRVALRFRSTPTLTLGNIGFRCARDVTQGSQEVPRDIQLETQARPKPAAIQARPKPAAIQARPKPAAIPDTTEMVLIPAGDFQMGSNDSNADDDEKPVHTVYVDAFYIDTYEVTNAQFKVFVDANPQWRKNRIPKKYHSGRYLQDWRGNSYPSGKENHPVVYVSWYAAMAYAQWAGKRLPTEAEWEKAARGGLVDKKYPRGNAIDTRQANYNKDVGNTTPVGRYAPNGYGLHDMAGNVWEWCLDAHEENFYARSPRRNPLASEMPLREVMTNYQNVTTSRVLRGGSWRIAARFVRVANRYGDAPSDSYNDLGFRCARDVTQGGPEGQRDVQLEKQATPQQDAHTSTILGKDGTEMVLIPAGDFQMGSNDSQAEDNEKPVHTVYVDAFYMDKYEVTNAQFKAFVDANPRWRKHRIPQKYRSGRYLQDWSRNSYPSGKGNHPVVFVSWYAAMAYAQWAGKRLPTEAEWEKAARGGLVDEKYPWGYSIDASKANYGKSIRSPTPLTTPVGNYAPNGYGLYDMAGNVWEWCLDAYEVDFYTHSPRRNPLASEMTLREVMTNYKNVTTLRVLRGGGWPNSAQNLRVAPRGRFSPTNANGLIGFRCAQDVTP